MGFKTKIGKIISNKITKLPILFQKNLNLPILYEKTKIFVPKVYQKFIFFIKVQLTEVMLKDTINGIIQDVHNLGIQVIEVLWTYAFLEIRFTDPHPLDSRIAHRIYGVINNLHTKQYDKFWQNCQILMCCAFELFCNRDIKSQLKSNVYQRFVLKQMGVPKVFDKDIINDGKMFQDAEPFPYMGINDFLGPNLRYIRRYPQIIPIDFILVAKLEIESFYRLPNLVLDKDEIEVLTYCRFRQTIKIQKRKEPLSLIDPIKTRILVRIEKTSSNLVSYSRNLISSTEDISLRNLSKWEDEKKIKNNLISSEGVNDNSIKPKVIAKSFIVKSSNLRYFIIRERRCIQNLVGENYEYELSPKEMLHKLELQKMEDNRCKIAVHKGRIKILRRIERKMYRKNNHSRMNCIRRIILH